MIIRTIRRNIITIPGLLLILSIIAFLSVVSGCAKNTPKGDSFEVMTIPGTEGYANSYIVSSNGLAAIIDPAKGEEILQLIEDNGLKPLIIILTHGHFDHIRGVETIKKAYPDIEVNVHPADRAKLGDPSGNLSSMFGELVSVKVKTSPVQEGILRMGNLTFEIMDTPGHTPGSISVLLGNYLFSGDTLFKGGVGRVDFPSGDPDALAKSLNKIKRIPSGTKILPGHGGSTTMGEEMANNPYL